MEVFEAEQGLQQKAFGVGLVQGDGSVFDDNLGSGGGERRVGQRRRRTTTANTKKKKKKVLRLHLPPHLEICVAELKNERDVALAGKDVHQLDNVHMLQLLQQLNLSQRRPMDAWGFGGSLGERQWQ